MTHPNTESVVSVDPEAAASPATAALLLSKLFPARVLLLVGQAVRILKTARDGLVGLLLLPFVVLKLARDDVRANLHAEAEALPPEPASLDRLARTQERGLARSLRRRVRAFSQRVGSGSKALSVAVYNTVVRLMLLPVATLLELLVVLVLQVLEFVYILARGKRLTTDRLLFNVNSLDVQARPWAAFAKQQMRALVLRLLDQSLITPARKRSVRAQYTTLASPASPPAEAPNQNIPEFGRVTNRDDIKLNMLENQFPWTPSGSYTRE